MPHWQATHKINQHGHGWSETWYCEAASDVAAMIKATALADARNVGLGPNSRIVGVRVSDVDVIGDGFVSFPNYTTIYPSESYRDDLVWSAALFRVTAGSKYRRMFNVRGFADEIMQRLASGALILSVGVNNFLTQYRSALIDNAFKLRVIDKDPPNATPRGVTAMIEDAPSGNTRLTLDTAGIGVGDQVRLRNFASANVSDKRYMTGVVRVQSILAGGGSMVVDKVWAILQQPNTMVPGQVIRRVMVFKEVSNMVFQGQGHHDTGRSFFVSRGRRRKVL
jgi:hypothetical protein